MNLSYQSDNKQFKKKIMEKIYGLFLEEDKNLKEAISKSEVKFGKLISDHSIFCGESFEQIETKASSKAEMLEQKINSTLNTIQTDNNEFKINTETNLNSINNAFNNLVQFKTNNSLSSEALKFYLIRSLNIYNVTKIESDLFGKNTNLSFIIEKINSQNGLLILMENKDYTLGFYTSKNFNKCNVLDNFIEDSQARLLKITNNSVQHYKVKSECSSNAIFIDKNYLCYIGKKELQIDYFEKKIKVFNKLSSFEQSDELMFAKNEDINFHSIDLYHVN